LALIELSLKSLEIALELPIGLLGTSLPLLQLFDPGFEGLLILFQSGQALI